MSQCTGLSQTLWSLFAQFHVFGWNSHVKPLALPIQHVSTPSGAALLENAIASEISARRRSSALRNSESVGKLEGIRHWLIINHKKNHIYIHYILYDYISLIVSGYHWGSSHMMKHPVFQDHGALPSRLSHQPAEKLPPPRESQTKLAK